MTIRIYGVRMDEQLAEAEPSLEQWRPLVEPDRWERIGRFRRWEDRWRTLTGDLLVRRVLRHVYDLPAGRLRYERNAYGKPSLAGERTVEFNVSHAGNWVVAAFDEQPIGIDVERIIDVEQEIGKHYFSRQEYADLCCKPQTERLSYFFDLWTCKESYIKAVGEGLSMPLDAFTVRKTSATRITLKTARSDARQWSLRQYELERGYKLSVCAGSSGFPEQVTIWRHAEFYRDPAELI